MANYNYAQLDPFALSGAGASLGDTSITLKSFQTIDGVNLAMSDFGSIGFGTLDPGNGALEEQISFTGVVQNANGTATLSGVHSIAFLTPYTSTSGLAKTHAGSTTFVISNTSGFYNQLTAKSNNEVLTGYWEAPDPVSSQGLVTNAYMLALINGGPITTNALIISATAGETVAAGNLVYQKVTDGYWYLCDADTATTVQNVALGIAQGSGTSTNPVAGGVLIRGVDTNQTGGSVGLAYASNTAGGITTSAGTTPKVVGEFQSATTILFDPSFYYTPTYNQSTFLAAIPGMIIQYAGTAAPTGFLACDGSAVSRTTYAALFAVIGTSYGTGNGSTTFNLPDGRGRTFIGAGTGSKVATFASRSSDTLTVTGLTSAANNEFQTGQAVTYHTTGSVITGLTNDTVYYVIRVTNTSFKLASTLANAQNGTQISLSGDGTGTQTFTLALTARTVGDTGGEENHAESSTEQLAHVHTNVYQATGGNRTVTSSSGSTVNENGSSASTGGNAAMNNMQPFFAGLWIIKT